MVIPTNDRQSKHPESGALVNRARQRRLDAKNKQLHCSILKNCTKYSVLSLFMSVPKLPRW